MPRPLVAIPARFSQSASALRYQAIVNARALSEAVLRAGGEPLTVHPWAPGGVAPWPALLWANGRVDLAGGRPRPGSDWVWHCAPVDEWDGTIPRWNGSPPERFG